MESLAFADLVARLFAVLASISTYTIPAHGPTIEALQRPILEARYCPRACPKFKAAYLKRRQTIVLDAALDLYGNPQHRSILLHELVHYLQDISGRFSKVARCQRQILHEDEAYALQIKYLRLFPRRYRIAPPVIRFSAARTANCLKKR